jgi:hypothetical protein
MSTERTMEFIGTVREYPLLDRWTPMEPEKKSTSRLRDRRTLTEPSLTTNGRSGPS